MDGALSLSGYGGGGQGVRVRNVTVPAGATGRQVNLQRQFGSASTFSLLSGTDANIQLDNGDGLALVAGVAAGATQTAIVQETVGSAATLRQMAYAFNCTGAPVVPAAPSVTLTPGDGQISVAWVDGSNGGATITEHPIYLNGSATPIASPAGAGPYVISGLTNGTSYSVQVAAKNVAGEGPKSTSQSATPSLVVMTPYTLLDNFDVIGSRTVGPAPATQTLVAPSVLGTGAIQLSMNGASNPSITTPNTSNEDPAAWDLIGFYINGGTDVFNSSLGTMLPRITAGGQTYVPAIDQTYGVITSIDWYPHTRGGRWLTYKASRLRVGGSWTGAALTSAGAGAIQVALQAQNPNSNRNQKITVDALIRPTRVKPAFVMTFDDVNVRQLTEAAPIMQAAAQSAGMPYPFAATGFLCQSLLDTSTKLTTAQALALKNDYRWTWSLDSGPLDEPFSSFESPAAAIAQLNTLRDSAIAGGFSTAADAKMFCYSFGGMTYWPTGTPNQQISITPNGTDSVVVSNTVWGLGIMAGMVAKNTGAAGNPVLVSARRLDLSQVTLKFDRIIPASAARTITLCAARRALTYTATGTAQITVDTTYLVPGMTMFAYGVLDGLTIVSVDVEGASGTVTMSGNVPTGTGVANFYLVDAPFAAGKMQDALIAAEYTVGRLGSSGGGNGVYTGYGLDPLAAIGMPAISTDDTLGTTTSLNRIITEMTDAYENGRDALTLMHFATAQSASNFQSLVGWMAARCAAGDFDILTLRDWKARVDARLPIA